MLEDATGIRRVVIACGYVDLRKGIDGLSMIIGGRYHQNPFEIHSFPTRRSSDLGRASCRERVYHLPQTSDGKPDDRYGRSR